MAFESLSSVLLIKQKYNEYQHFSLENSEATPSSASPEEAYKQIFQGTTFVNVSPLYHVQTLRNKEDEYTFLIVAMIEKRFVVGKTAAAYNNTLKQM